MPENVGWKSEPIKVEGNAVLRWIGNQRMCWQQVRNEWMEVDESRAGELYLHTIYSLLQPPTKTSLKPTHGLSRSVMTHDVAKASKQALIT